MSTDTNAGADLGLCICGADAVWYRVSPPSPARKQKRSALSSIGIDDVEENLCDGCYKGFTGNADAAVPGWKRLDVLKRQVRAGEEDQDSRAPWDTDGVGESQVGYDDW
jgi:hypothetical protein